MPVYKVFTWNMQRGRSISRGDATITERFRVLKDLVDWADFGFITEPGQDVRNGLNAYYGLQGLRGRYYVSTLVDNQNDAMACRPVVYSRHGFARAPQGAKPYLRYQSGAEQANRHPAAGIVALFNGDGQGNNELLLVSFHATSGFGAAQNCEGYFDSFYEFDGHSSIPLLWIVGGDFNCNPRNGVYMPAVSTHQSNHILDGFFADQQATNFEVKLTSGPQTYVDGNDPGEGQLIIGNANAGNANARGFVVNGLHLSDHCPVTAQFQIEPLHAGMDVDTADILPAGTRRTRKRKVPTDFDTSTTKKPKR
ncbi:MAG: hypothetical protein JO015_21550 [Verrucomicrobia bacterium]|nr:hypothetical protein [Verrucomicrobiota bacterium]